MHMSDALLSPAVGAAFWAGTVVAIAYCSRKLKKNPDDRIIPLMGVLGAFIFAAQMINFTIPATGSSGHISGGMMLSILIGPYAAFIAMSSVLIIQSLFFADGGILALGCNIWNLGVYPCFVAYPLIYKTLTKGSSDTKRTAPASILSAVAGLQLGAFSVVVQTVLSGRSEMPFDTFLSLMLAIHLAIGLIEGFVTAGVVNFVRHMRPEILKAVSNSEPFPNRISIRKILTAFLLAAFVIGGGLSWFASSHPDGLEWALERVHGNPDIPAEKKGIIEMLRSLQDKTAFLPDYTFRENNSSGEKAGTSISGIIGAVMVFLILVLVGIVIKTFKKRKAG